jgi:nitric oxide reductase NorD protein
VPEAEDVIIDAAERLSGAVRSLWHRHRHTVDPRGVLLIDVKQRLEVLTCACFGQAWPLTPCDADLPPNWLAKRFGNPPPWQGLPYAEAFTDGAQIFLPRRLCLSEDDAGNRDSLRLIALMLGLRLARGSVAQCPASPVARDLFWAADGAVVEAVLVSDFPGLESQLTVARHQVLASRPQLAALSPGERAVEQIVRHLLEAPFGRVACVLPDFPADLPAPEAMALWAHRIADEWPFRSAGAYRGMAPVFHWGRPRPDILNAVRAVTPGTTTDAVRQAPTYSQQLPRRIASREVTDEAADERQGPFLVPCGDPQQSVQDPAGLRRPPDQEETIDVETLAEELARLKHVPRLQSEGTVWEILEEDGERRHQAVVPHVQGAEETAGMAYPEWDHRAGAYRHGHCVVREREALAGAVEWSASILDEHRALLYDVRRRFEALRPKRERWTRQVEGDNLDLDAYVEDFAARHAGRSPSDRLYLADRPRRRDVSVALLIDASGSTDAWVSGGRRVIEVEKVATLVFCEALETLRDRYAVYAFYGRGPRDVRVMRVKGFTEPYGKAVQTRIAGLHGDAFTRLGASIRHLTALLARQRARLRLLLLLSDGKPNDEDIYEGTYGIKDTRQAVAEAWVQGVNLFCLAIDRQGTIYLPQMFGAHGYRVLWDVTQLPQCLPEIYRRITSARA